MIGENIKTLRKIHGLTQHALADCLGVKRSLIGAYEEGRAEPKLDLIVKMANFFNVKIDDFINVNYAEKPALSYWVAFDWDKIETRPTEYGKYLICRKDGKIHWETWNGSGWAYNGKEIKFWAKIVKP